jgi:GxxExxY protein
MNADERGFRPLESDALTERILACVFDVSNVLGAGFLEKVYRRALLEELRLSGLRAETEVPFRVSYKGRYVGDYLTDIVVEYRVVVELKCADHLSKEHLAQCINYLKASGRTVALLVNFQKPKVEWRRVVHGL